MNNEQQQQPGPNLISDELFYKLTAAHARLHQLQSVVVIPQDEAGRIAHDEEVKLLTEQLSAVFLAHAPEFLGAVYVLKHEYGPLIRALAPVVQNAIRISGSTAPISEAARAEFTEKNQ